jgi:hypothetical protein
MSQHRVFARSGRYSDRTSDLYRPPLPLLAGDEPRVGAQVVYEL